MYKFIPFSKSISFCVYVGEWVSGCSEWVATFLLLVSALTPVCAVGSVSQARVFWLTFESMKDSPSHYFLPVPWGRRWVCDVHTLQVSQPAGEQGPYQIWQSATHIWHASVSAGWNIADQDPVTTSPLASQVTGLARVTIVTVLEALESAKEVGTPTAFIAPLKCLNK